MFDARTGRSVQMLEHVENLAASALAFGSTASVSCKTEYLATSRNRGPVNGTYSICIIVTIRLAPQTPSSITVYLENTDTDKY